MTPPTTPARLRLHAGVLLSGIAGLVWQLAWVRQLGLALGGTVVAASIGTGVFLGGLGVGARLGGAHADRLARPARAFAACELAVAGWGLLLVPVLAALPALPLGGTVVDGRGWLVPSPAAHAVHLLVAAALLGPPATAMGASLPLLARPATAGAPPGDVPFRLGLLAAANTAGAAVGALLADLVLVPALGVRGTCLLAAALGGLAALLGASVNRGPRTRAPRTPAPATPAPATPAPGDDARAAPARSVALALALALAGFAAMGLEVVWLRFLGSALGPYRAVFSQLLAVLLMGWLAGAVIAGALTLPAARARVPALAAFAAAQTVVAVAALLGLALHNPRALLLRQLALAADGAPVAARLGVNLGVVAAVVGPAAVAMGAAFPLGSALLAPRGAALGRAVGGLWRATTLGNAGGALLTGLVLLPALGMQGAALLLAGLAAAAPLPLLLRRAPPPALPCADAPPRLATPLPHREAEPRFYPSVLCAGGLLAVGAIASALPADAVLWASFPHGRAQEEGVLAVAEGLDETIVVTGRPEGPARLWTNGHPMSSTRPSAQRYMRLLAHLPLLAMEAPTRVLVVCFGVGNTLHAASLHPGVARIELADLSAGVLAQAERFAHANRGVLADPRVTVHVDDGRHVLGGLAPRSLDLVALEPPPLAHAGVAALYSRELYALAYDRLAEGGWIAQWLPAYQVPGDTALALVRAFVEVFPGATLLVGDGRELLLVGVRGGRPTLDAAAIARRMAVPAVADDLAAIGIRDIRDLVATFAADGEHLREVTAGARPVTDDWPAAEWSQVSHVAITRLPASLFAPAGWRRFAPALADDAALAATMAENARRWASEDFLGYSTLPRDAPATGADAGPPAR